MMKTITITDYLNGTVTEQEVADYTIGKLLEQGYASLDMDGNCVYRGPEGSKCAIGWLIPDDAYDPNMDAYNANGVTDVTNKYFRKNEDELCAFDLRIQFLSELQVLHDNALSGVKDAMGRDEDFLESFKHSAEFYYATKGLVFPFK
jgi:hypothetical protein